MRDWKRERGRERERERDVEWADERLGEGGIEGMRRENVIHLRP